MYSKQYELNKKSNCLGTKTKLTEEDKKRMKIKDGQSHYYKWRSYEDVYNES